MLHVKVFKLRHTEQLAQLPIIIGHLEYSYPWLGRWCPCYLPKILGPSSISSILELVSRYRFPGSTRGCLISIFASSQGVSRTLQSLCHCPRRPFSKHLSLFGFPCIKCLLPFLPVEFGYASLSVLAEINLEWKRKHMSRHGSCYFLSQFFFANEREDNIAMCDISHNGDTAKMRLVLRWNNCSGLAAVPGLHLAWCDFSSPQLWAGRNSVAFADADAEKHGNKAETIWCHLS